MDNTRQGRYINYCPSDGRRGGPTDEIFLKLAISVEGGIIKCGADRAGGGGKAGSRALEPDLSQAKYSTGGVASVIIIAGVEERAR